MNFHAGVGTGGESIWGGEFEDEFHPNLKHDRPYTVSMANAGPNSNGSQFFVTVIPCVSAALISSKQAANESWNLIRCLFVCVQPWLDNKHTVFGRVMRGMETVQSISMVKTNPKTDKPYDDVSIINITLK